MKDQNYLKGIVHLKFCNFVIIYSLFCRSKPVWLCGKYVFFCPYNESQQSDKQYCKKKRILLLLLVLFCLGLYYKYLNHLYKFIYLRKKSHHIYKNCLEKKQWRQKHIFKSNGKQNNFCYSDSCFFGAKTVIFSDTFTLLLCI